jgi:hypothetical protein
MNKEFIRETVQKEILNGIKKELDSALIFTYIQSIEQENKELHNKIDKAIEYIEDYGHGYDCTGDGYYCLDEDNQKELLKILKESDVNEYGRKSNIY